jgi:phosphoglycolate phosphatase
MAAPGGPRDRAVTYRLVIFDFDGTLADSSGWFFAELNHLADRFGFRRVDDAALARLRGEDSRAVLRELGLPAWKLPMIARHLRGRVAEEAERIRLFEGAEAMLRRLAGQGLVLALVSSNAESTARRIMGPGCAGLIAHYACGASIFGKAAKFRAVLRKAGVAPGQAIAIGDEARDIEAAGEAGIAAGAVTWGYATAGLLRGLGPSMVFDRMEEIPARLAPGS